MEGSRRVYLVIDATRCALPLGVVPSGQAPAADGSHHCCNGPSSTGTPRGRFMGHENYASNGEQECRAQREGEWTDQERTRKALRVICHSIAQWPDW
jgi:hypothetical protein